MTLKMTEARAELLIDVRDGEVWQQSNGESMRTGADEYWEPMVRVSQEMADMEAEGWVQLIELSWSRRWQLTEAGYEVLAAAARKAG